MLNAQLFTLLNKHYYKQQIYEFVGMEYAFYLLEQKWNISVNIVCDAK